MFILTINITYGDDMNNNSWTTSMYTFCCPSTVKVYIHIYKVVCQLNK